MGNELLRTRSSIRFGAFELDVRSGELRKGPKRLRVPDQSIQILAALLAEPGELVTREQLRGRLWPSDTFVDFEHGLNAAVRRLRAALNDSADEPRFIETLPRRGYRFIGRVEATPSLPLPRSTEEVLRTTAVARSPSIAVLPFENVSGDPESEYFGDGLAEDLINALTDVSGLKVIARASVFAFKGKHEDVRRIAETLGVAHVLAGSVRKAGNRIRVIAELSTATDGTCVWSERYDRNLEDVFAIQDEIASAITSALQTRLLTPLTAARRYRPTIHAYEAFLKGRYFQFSPGWGIESLERAQAYYRQALELDSRFALPHINIAACYYTLAALGVQAVREVLPLFQDEVEAAIRLDPDLAEAHVALAVSAALFQHDWKTAERHFQRAMAHEPVPIGVRHWAGASYLLAIRPEEGIKQLQLALEDDPLNASVRFFRATCKLAADRVEDAAADYRACLELNERFHPAMGGLAMAYHAQGLVEEALECAEKSHALAPFDGIASARLAGLLARRGEMGRSQKLMEQLPPLQETFASFVFHALSGDVERAGDWAERAVEERTPMIAGSLRMPFAKELRSSARWPKLAKMMNLPER